MFRQSCYSLNMAFVINKITSGEQVEDIATMIRKTLAGSRFTAEVTTPTTKRVEIRTVRLTYHKDYCGNHPLPCPVRAFSKPHKKTRQLEGADWVGFNDMLNDLLDAIGCVCDCASSHVIIRKSGARCMRYDAQTLNGIDSEWKRNSGVFENHIGNNRNAHAEFPQGTPGFATAYGQPNYPAHHDH